MLMQPWGKTAVFGYRTEMSVTGSSHWPRESHAQQDQVDWWCKYILPAGGVLLDPFCGSGTMLVAGLDHGASKAIGIDKEKKYLAIAKRRITKG